MEANEDLYKRIAELETQQELSAQQSLALAKANANAGMLMSELEDKNKALAQAHAKLRWNSLAQTIVNQLMTLALQDHSVDSLLKRALEILVAVPWLSKEGKGAIFLYEEKKKDLVLRNYVGLSDDQIQGCSRVAFGQCLCGRAAENRDIIFATNKDARHDIVAVGEETQDHGHYCLPLLFRDELLGVVALYTSVGHEESDEEKIFLYAVANVLTGIIMTRREAEELNQANEDLERNRQMLAAMLKDLQIVNQQLKEAQAQVIHAEKLAAVGQLSAGVAHEIKNPLAIIILGVEFLQSKLTEADEDSRKYLKMIVDSADRANNVVIELLKFSRSTGLSLKETNIHEAIDKALKFVQNKAKTKTIVFQKEYADDIGTIAADNILLEQMLMNIFGNAIDAIEQEGCVQIRTYLKKDGEYLGIEIQDDGCGMEKETAKRIFDPFYTTKEQGEGTGLGLSTVYMILEKHGGMIDVKSEVGQGTTFFITLPVKQKI